MKRALLTLSVLGLGLMATGCTKPHYVENNISRLHGERTIVRDVGANTRVNEYDGDYIKGNGYIYGAKTEGNVEKHRKKAHRRHYNRQANYSNYPSYPTQGMNTTYNHGGELNTYNNMGSGLRAYD